MLQADTAHSDDLISVTQDSIEKPDETAEDESYIFDEEAKRQVLDIILRRLKSSIFRRKKSLPKLTKAEWHRKADLSLLLAITTSSICFDSNMPDNIVRQTL